MNDRSQYTANLLRIRRSLGLAKKPRTRLPRQVWPKPIQREYAKAIIAIVQRLRVRLQPLWDELPMLVATAQADRRHDAGEGRRIRALIEQAMVELLTVEEVEALALQFAQRTSTYQRIQLNRQVRAALGADIFIADRMMEAVMDGFVAENVSLIRGLTMEMALDVEKIVTRNVQAGALQGTLAKELDERFAFGEGRAKLIARDQIGKFYGQANAVRQQEMGVTHFFWRTVNDERVRPEHAERAREGQNRFSYDDPPDGELPGEPINCFPGSTVVSSDSPVTKLYRRWYSGEGTVLSTDDGSVLTSTPNHPVLTTRGWVASKFVQVGDYVVKASPERLKAFVPDSENMQSSIEQVFASLAPLGVLERRQILAGGFHGDAANEQVDVVDVHRYLRLERDIELSKSFCQYLLSQADKSRLPVSPFYLFFDRSCSSSHGFVRGGSKLLSLLLRSDSHSGEHCRTAISWLNATANQFRSNGSSRDVKVLCEALNTPPVGVELWQHISRIVSSIVRRAVDVTPSLKPLSAQQFTEAAAANVQLGRNLGDSFCGQQTTRVVKNVRSDLAVHVYNLETESSWYIAQKLIVHNCRCYPEPDFTDILGNS